MLLFILITITHAQSAKPLTLQDLVQMQKAGFDDQTTTNAIAANGTATTTARRNFPCSTINRTESFCPPSAGRKARFNRLRRRA
jgi:hypothetical protein